MKSQITLITLILTLCLLGCVPNATPYPTNTPYPTYTSYPIIKSTSIPKPTCTQTPIIARFLGSKPPWSSGAIASPYHYAMINADGIYAHDALQAIAEYEASDLATKGEWVPDNRNRLIYCVTCAGEWSIGLRYEIIDVYGHHEGEKWCYYLDYVFGPTSYPTKQDIFGMLGTLDAASCGYLRDK